MGNIIESLVKEAYNGCITEYESADLRIGGNLDTTIYDRGCTDFVWNRHRGKEVDSSERRLQRLNFEENLIEKECFCY